MLDRVKYQIRNPDYVIEELILSGMITQTEFLKRIIPRFDLEYFNTPEIRTIISWILNYYKTHGEAPGPEIGTICRVESRHDKTIQREKFENLLSAILEQHGETFNTEYVLPKALVFFKKRSLTIALENTRHFLDKSDLEEAELAYYKYKEIAQGIKQNLDPLGNEALQLWWRHADKELLHFPGYLGNYLAPICRKQLVGIMGPPKRGKTTVLTEFACVGLMHKLKVIVFNLEMDPDKYNQRIATRIAGQPKIVTEYQDFRLPLLDCLKNQTGECRLPQRKNQIDLFGDDNKILPYTPDLDGRYKVCTHCLRKGKDDYKFAVWYQTKRYSQITIRDFKQIQDDFRTIFGEHNLVVESYPRGKFSFTNLENRLTLLEQERNFIPDIIIVDYVDIMKKEHRREHRFEIGDLWDQLSALSQERNCLVVTASQTNRAAENKPDLTMSDLAEDYSKAMVADMFLVLNQTSQEKDQQVARMAIVLHRHREFSLHYQCRVLQAPKIGQFNLDSCSAYRKLSR